MRVVECLRQIVPNLPILPKISQHTKWQHTISKSNSNYPNPNPLVSMISSVSLIFHKFYHKNGVSKTKSGLKT